MDIKKQNQLDQTLALFYFGYKTFTKKPDEILEKYGIQRMHHRIIFFIAELPGLSVNELLTLLEITKQALHGPLKKLIQKGFVRSEQCEKDLRVKNLFLTIEGKKLEQELSSVQKEQLNEIFLQLGEEYKDAWVEIMKKLSSNRPGYELWINKD
jgi:DNA-binding MarR family transcriptional regulator